MISQLFRLQKIQLLQLNLLCHLVVNLSQCTCGALKIPDVEIPTTTTTTSIAEELTQCTVG